MFGSHQLNGLPFHELSAHDALSAHPFFGQKLCGRVFSYIASIARILPWDCSLYCAQRQWQQANRGEFFLSHLAVYLRNVDHRQQRWTCQLLCRSAQLPCPSPLKLASLLLTSGASLCLDFYTRKHFALRYPPGWVDITSRLQKLHIIRPPPLSVST